MVVLEEYLGVVLYGGGDKTAGVNFLFLFYGDVVIFDVFFFG